MIIRCSIAYCPWRARYFWDVDRRRKYYECWFHGNEEIWYGILWDIFTKPARAFYNFIRYRI